MIAEQEHDDDLRELGAAISRLCVDLGMTSGAAPRRNDDTKPQASHDISVKVPRPVAKYLRVGGHVDVRICGVRYVGRVSRLRITERLTTAVLAVEGFVPSEPWGFVNQAEVSVIWPTRMS